MKIFCHECKNIISSRFEWDNNNDDKLIFSMIYDGKLCSILLVLYTSCTKISKLNLFQIQFDYFNVFIYVE